MVFYLLLNFKVEPNEKSQIPVKLNKNPVSMCPEKGINVSLIPRT